MQEFLKNESIKKKKKTQCIYKQRHLEAQLAPTSKQ